jgi:hypothetical protein
MASRSTPSLLSQSTTSTAVAPSGGDEDKDYDLALANLMSTYGLTGHPMDLTSMYPSREQVQATIQREKKRGVFAAIRGSSSQQAAPEMVQVKEEKEAGEAAAATDEGDEKKSAQKAKRWSLKPAFRRSQ